MKKSTYLALAAMFGFAFAFSPVVKAAEVYSGTYGDREYYSGAQTDKDVGMTDATRSDNLDQGRLDNRGVVGGYIPGGSPSIDRTYSDYRTDQRGTDWDVGMTQPQFTDNLDQGRLDSRGLIGGRGTGSPSIDRSAMDRERNLGTHSEARVGGLHDVQDMIGAAVTDSHGDHLGTVQSLVADDMGRIDFAVVRTETKDIAVPFQALNHTGMGHFSLNMTEDELMAAPVFDRGYLADSTWPGQVYRYYGLQPRW